MTVDTLVTKEKKRPLLLGEEMDGAVKEYIKSLRTTGAVVNTVVVMAAAVGIVAARDVTKLQEYDGHLYGGHIEKLGKISTESDGLCEIKMFKCG